MSGMTGPDPEPTSEPNAALADFLTTEPEARAADSLNRILQAVRSHLGMDVAFVSEFKEGRRFFRYVDAASQAPMQPGESRPVEGSYCQRIVDGRLPELIPDTAAVPAAMALPVTTALGIGAYLGVPIRLKNGEVYGTFCCMNFSSKESLNERDLNVVRAFAEVVAFQIQRDFDQEQEKVDKIRRVRSVLQHGGLSVVYQPIYRVGDQRVEGLECLARFAIEPVRSPDVWFSEAFEVDLGVELEIAAIRAGLACLSAIPPDVYVSVNASPATLLTPDFAAALQSAPMNRIVLELTEHASISDYAEAMRALAPLRRNGLRLAVDDAGAGFSSFRHVLLLKPDLIKLDGSIIRQIDIDPDRRALAEALIGFGRAMGTQIIAECVETAPELAAVRLLGVDHVQGYFLARPMALADVVQLLDGTAAVADSPEARLPPMAQTQRSRNERLEDCIPGASRGGRSGQNAKSTPIRSGERNRGLLNCRKRPPEGRPLLT